MTDRETVRQWGHVLASLVRRSVPWCFSICSATVLCWTAENGWKRPRFLAGSESDVRQWGRVASGPFWSRDRWRKLGFLVGSESDVRQWQRSKKGPIRHALAGGFSVHKLIFLVTRRLLWELGTRGRFGRLWRSSQLCSGERAVLEP